jgi:RecB family exonuclease
VTRISPRHTRLLRAIDLATFRCTVAELAMSGTPLEIRDRIVVVPTRAAAEQLIRGIERDLVEGAVLLPDLVTPRQLVSHLSTRLAHMVPALTDADREALLGVCCRAAVAAGFAPPFRLRPGLIAETLRFYDALRRNEKDVDAFERLALGMLEPGAELDRGAARLVQQTRFLVAAFREFERRSIEAGVDEHQLRQRLLDHHGTHGYRHVIVAVGDQTFDRYGLCAADWDLLSRLPALERLDVVITDSVLFGAAHERMHRLLPGLEEVRCATAVADAPKLSVPAGDQLHHVSRDRDEEVSAFARWVKQKARAGAVPLHRVALVVEQPLPYLYLARDLFRSAGIPCQMFDELPLAAQPYAAALDLVLTFVSSGFARGPAIELLRSPYFRFAADDQPALDAGDSAALDRALAEAGYLGDVDALESMIEEWSAGPSSRRQLRRAAGAAAHLVSAARELRGLREPLPIHEQLHLVLTFLMGRASEVAPAGEQSSSVRARRAVHGILLGLRDAFARFDAGPVAFDDVAGMIRRWIEGHTFAPRAGDDGVHIVDAESARFGDFDVISLTGLVDGEWPDRPRRNIFYAPEILRELGWPSERERRNAVRARFTELLRLPASRVRVSTFNLESDTVVSPSPLLADLAEAGLEVVEEPDERLRIFEHEALTLEPLRLDAVPPEARDWAAHRDAVRNTVVRGISDPYPSRAYSVSALERYQDCPFKFFAADILRLEEEPEDQSTLTPRRRGQLLHEILQRFFAAWDEQRVGAITPDNVGRAGELFAGIAEPMLAGLPESEAALERTRLFGSAISVGVADVVLGLEAVRKGEVRGRWLEHRLEGAFRLGRQDGPAVLLRGVADRIDLMPGRQLRVVDYKSGAVPETSRALQVPIYALCAQEQLTARDGAPWTIAEAEYVSLAGRRSSVPVVQATDGAADREEALQGARERLDAVLAGMRDGDCAPRPYDPLICRSCAFSSVCRKDFGGEE